ncbi:MAG TPA: potassium channel family protein [Acidimicrobiales bacterium]|nr:potassium channel family protein [Acidimicrobiales bacterium]
MSAVGVVELVVGGAVTVLGLTDLFLTVFNYDGFTFVAGRYQRYVWHALRALSRLAPGRARPAALSLSSAGLLPATVALWLAMETVGFGFLYAAGLSTHGFAVTHGVGRDLGGALYLSAGVITTLSFGDVIAVGGVWRALVDVEAMVGLATFTLSIGYVVTTFGILGDLDRLHNTVRRHADRPQRPSSVLVRHYRGGSPTELPDLLQVLATSLESYDEGLRRYPVAYYFHTRRVERSVPRVFLTLGELLALVRWGLVADDPMRDDPWLAALLEQYSTTLRRLQHSFVGPVPMSPAPVIDEPAFADAYRADVSVDPHVAAFRDMQGRTRSATGAPMPPDPDIDLVYRRYSEWAEFTHARDTVLRRISAHLGYDWADMADGLRPST